MSNVIYDSSALLALIFQEKGAEIAQGYLPQAMMSLINHAETTGILIASGMPKNEAFSIVTGLVPHQVSFDMEQAKLTASLQSKTQRFGLSLGDCACLALAKARTLPVVTADKAWSKLSAGIKIIQIR